MLMPNLQLLDSGEGSPFIAGIYSFRERLAEILASVLPEPQASLTQGILLGLRVQFPMN